MEVEEFTIKFKEGDVLVSRAWVFIYAGLKESDIFFVNGVPRHAVIYHALVHKDKLCEITIQTRTGIGYVEGNDFRLATNNEKKYLFNELEKKHLRWNPETKSLEYIGPSLYIRGCRTTILILMFVKILGYYLDISDFLVIFAEEI